MDNHGNELNDEKIRMLNGHSVMNALASHKNVITKNDLLQYFILSSDEQLDPVEHELKRILGNGVANGFIIKDGDKYALPSHANIIYEADCDDRGEDDKLDVKPDIDELDEQEEPDIKPDLDELEVDELEEPDIKPDLDELNEATENPVGTTATIKSEPKVGVSIQMASTGFRVSFPNEECRPSTSAGPSSLSSCPPSSIKFEPESECRPSTSVGGVSIKLDPGSECRPSTSAGARNFSSRSPSLELQFDFPGFTKSDIKVADRKRKADFKESVAEHEPVVPLRRPRLELDNFGLSTILVKDEREEEDDEESDDEEDESTSLRRSTRTKRKPDPRCPPSCN